MSSQFTITQTSQTPPVTEVHLGGELLGWAYPSDGCEEPAGTPMAAKYAGGGCVYTQHESIDDALAHIKG